MSPLTPRSQLARAKSERKEITCPWSTCASKARAIRPTALSPPSANAPIPLSLFAAVSDRSVDAGVYGSLCVVAAAAALAFAVEYHKHRSASKSANQWRFQGCFLLCAAAGLVLASLKCAFFLAFRWQQKSPELADAPKASPAFYGFTAGYYTM
jgi:hypothetical protein